MPALETRRVGKTYDRVHWVLRDASIQVDPAEVVVVIGRSGSGKSTLLNLAAGLEPPSEGSVRIGDVDLESLEEADRAHLRLTRIGIVFQRFFLIPELTVAENVRLPMKLAKRRDARARTQELLTFFGIAHRANAFPATLSGGELQRAAIARALGNEPTVILADEPTANLDDANAENALAALREVAERYETGVFIASHDSMVREAADRVYEIVDGRILGDGSPKAPPPPARPPVAPVKGREAVAAGPPPRKGPRA